MSPNGDWEEDVVVANACPVSAGVRALPQAARGEVGAPADRIDRVAREAVDVEARQIRGNRLPGLAAVTTGGEDFVTGNDDRAIGAGCMAIASAVVAT